jgi:DNA polymerase-4
MERVSLAEIPGIGPKFQRRLQDRGLVRASDVWRHDPGTLTRWYGDRAARWLEERSRGISTAPVVEREAAKSISHEDTFAEDVDDDVVIQAELRRLTEKTASALRADGLTARTVTVKLKDADFQLRSARRSLAEPIESDRAIADIALTLLARLRTKRRFPARLVGIGLSGLEAGRGGQLALFDAPVEGAESSKDRAVSKAMDSVRQKLGPKAISRGRLIRPS